MAQNIMAATSALPSVLVSQGISNTEGVVYTVASATSVKIASATIANTTGSAATIAISVVKAGGTAGNGNRVIPPFSLAANDSSVVSELVGAFLGPGDFISTISGTNNAISLVITGVAFS